MGTRFPSARVAGVAGIVFFVLTAIPGFASGAPPDPSDPAAKFLAYYQDHRSGILAGDLLSTFGSVFGFLFFGKLLARFRRAEGGDGALTNTALLGIAVTATIATVGGLLSAAAALRVGAASHVTAETLSALNDASNIAFTLIAFPLAALLIAGGLIVLGSRALPQWLGILYLVAAALELVGGCAVVNSTGGFSPGGVSGLLLILLPLAVFVLATSILMLLRPARFDEVR